MVYNTVKPCPPPKTNMEPENAHLEKDKHRPKVINCLGSKIVFGAIFISGCLLITQPGLEPECFPSLVTCWHLTGAASTTAGALSDETRLTHFIEEPKLQVSHENRAQTVV